MPLRGRSSSTQVVIINMLLVGSWVRRRYATEWQAVSQSESVGWLVVCVWSFKGHTEEKEVEQRLLVDLLTSRQFMLLILSCDIANHEGVSQIRIPISCHLLVVREETRYSSYWVTRITTTTSVHEIFEYWRSLLELASQWLGCKVNGPPVAHLPTSSSDHGGPRQVYGMKEEQILFLSVIEEWRWILLSSRGD